MNVVWAADGADGAEFAGDFEAAEDFGADTEAASACGSVWASQDCASHGLQPAQPTSGGSSSRSTSSSSSCGHHQTETGEMEITKQRPAGHGASKWRRSHPRSSSPAASP